MSNNNNQCRSVNWRWHNEGDITYLPRAATTRTDFDTYNYLGSDRFVEDASFLRLNYVQLSYNFDKNFVKSLGLSRLTASLNINNLFKITKYSGVDPEISQGGWSPARDGARTPRSKSFTFSLNIGL